MAGVELFVSETRADVDSPPTSSFSKHIPSFRDYVSGVSEALEGEFAGLSELRRSAKGLSESQREVARWEKQLVKALEGLADLHSAQGFALDPVVAKGFAKLSVILRQLAGMTVSLAQCLENSLIFPLDNLKTGREEMGEAGKEVQTAVGLYQARLAKLAKQRSKEASWKAPLSPADLAESLCLERTRVQQHLATFFLAHNRQRSRKGSELIDNLLLYLHRQEETLAEGLRATEECHESMAQLAREISSVRQREDEERKDLHQVQTLVSDSASRLQPRPPSADPAPPASAPPPTNGSAPTTHQGTLWKRSRYGHWQRRERCRVEKAVLYVPHSDASEPPLELPLRQSDVRLASDEGGGTLTRRFVVNLHPEGCREFQAEDAADARRWVAVCKAAQASAFSHQGNGVSTASLKDSSSQGRRALVRRLRAVPGNEACVDCGTADEVTWVSTNLGVLMCIACAGVHRELGVQVSRTQSLTLDAMSAPEFLLPLAVGNRRLNALLLSKTIAGVSHALPPSPSAQQRKELIRAKYRSLAFLDPMVELTEESLHDCVAASDPAGLVSIFLRKPEAKLLAAQPLILHRAIGVAGADGSLAALAVVELLLLHEADVKSLSSASSSSVFHLVAKAGQRRLLKLLLTAKAKDLAQPNGEGLRAEQVAKDAVTAEILRREIPLEPSDVLTVLGDEVVREEVEVGGSASARRPSSAEDHFGSLPDTSGLCQSTSGPRPLPPKRNGSGRSGGGERRCRALFDCRADREDELSFRKGETIVVTESRVEGEDPAWIRGHIAGEPKRKGVFPASFVTFT